MIEKQVKDDINLLKLMMNDRRKSKYLYQPTNYWLNYEKLLITELYNYGLYNFRRRRNSVLSSFGATDLTIMSLSLNKLSIWKRSLSFKILNLLYGIISIRKIIEKLSRTISGFNYYNIRRLLYEFAKIYGKLNGAEPIESFETSSVGSPEDLFTIDNRKYTLSILNYYIYYAYCCQFIDFNSIDSMMEIGSGVGKQIEVIKKLHPQINFYLLDIPPQLYVCEQYLTELFPNSVISYRKTRDMTKIEGNKKGKIYIFGNWKIEELSNFNYDLFWNSASFQEMEPEIALNYLKFVNSQTKNSIFLHELMSGKEKASKKGKHGVLEETILEHYKKGLQNFAIENISDSLNLIRMNPKYKFSFWKRKI